MANQPFQGDQGGVPSPSPPPSSNISNLKAIADQDSAGVTVSFTVTSLKNTFGLNLLRSFTPSVNAATIITSITRQTGSKVYDDRDPSVIGRTVYYWVQMLGVEDFVVNIGPVSAFVGPPIPPLVPTWMEGSNDAGGVIAGAVQVHIVCELPAGADFNGGVVVYIAGYLGNAASVPIFQKVSQTLSLYLKQTGEHVTFKVASVNAAGVLSGFSANFALLLNGVQTKPCRLTGLSAVEGNGVTQIGFTASPEPSVQGYRLYRSAFGGTFAGAVLVSTLVATDQPQYSIEDAHVNGHAHTYQWYVTAFNPQGESTPSEALFPPTWWV